MIVSSNKLVTSTYFKEDKMLTSIYSGRFKQNMAVEHGNKLLEFFSTNEVKGILIDIQTLFGSFLKLMDYYKEGYPAALEGGLKNIAYVVSDDLIVINLIGKYELLAKSFGVNTAVFTNFDDAFHWLQKANNAS